MGLGRFDEEALAEFREKALSYYGESSLSEDYGLLDAARAAVNAVGNAARAAVNAVRGGNNQTVTPIAPAPIGRQGATAAAAASGVTSIAPPAARISGGGGNSSSSSGGGGNSSSGGNNSRPAAAPRESAADREARLRREREEAERRAEAERKERERLERERKAAEERIRRQRVAAERDRRQRLQAIDRNVTNRVLEGALERELGDKPDSESQLCQRPDGSIYGIVRGRRCITGRPISERPADDPTERINEAARNNPDQQMLPVGQRTAGGTSPATSADARVSGNQTRTLASDEDTTA